MQRVEFSNKVRAEAFLRCKGHCEKCAAKLKRGECEFDHIIAFYLTQDSTLENCQVLCTPCHRGVGAKTANDQKIISKVKRVKAKNDGTFKRNGGFQKPDGMKFDWRSGRYVRAEQ